MSVAHDGQSKSEIVANIVAACKQLMEKAPGGTANIKNIHLKGSDTTSVPLYIDFGNFSSCLYVHFEKIFA